MGTAHESSVAQQAALLREDQVHDFRLFHLNVSHGCISNDCILLSAHPQIYRIATTLFMIGCITFHSELTYIPTSMKARYLQVMNYVSWNH